jgi:hypothetical protein
MRRAYNPLTVSLIIDGRRWLNPILTTSQDDSRCRYRRLSGLSSFQLLENGIARRVCVTVAIFLDDSSDKFGVIKRDTNWFQ